MGSDVMMTPFGDGLSTSDRFLGTYGRNTAELNELCKTFPKEYFSDGQFAIHRTKAGDKANRDDFIKRVALFLYDFRIHPEERAIMYFKKHSDNTYMVCTTETLARELNVLWEFFFRCTPTKEVDECAKNIMRSVTEKADIRDRVFRLADDLFYVPDENDAILSLPPDGKECFFTLDGPYSLFNGNEYLTGLVKESYDNFLGILDSKEYKGLQFKDFYEVLPRDFSWVRLWSAEDVEGYKDRYWDIMIAYSTPFFKRLIKKAYMLDGPTRTGKSTCRDVLAFIFGMDKVAEVRIPDYNNYHVNNKLAYCCVNAPDEEKGGAISKEACANFKTLATKGSVELAVKNKQPIRADGQFMSFHPTNSNIEWPDTEASPCLRRCLTIKFFKDLSKFDTGSKGFIETTFLEHPDELARFMGQVFALASYFSRENKEFFISQKMIETNAFISAETNSLDLYYQYFFKYFDAVSNENFLWEDYQYACYEFGWTQQNKSAMRQRFGILLMNKPTPKKIGTKSVRYVRHPKFSQPQVLYPDYTIHVLNSFAQKDTTPWGCAAQMHDAKQSVVATLQRMEEQRLAEKEEKESEPDQMSFEEVFNG